MKCPECGSKNYGSSGSEIICHECGLVLDDSLIEQPLQTNPASAPQIATAGTYQYDGRIVKTGWLFSTKQKNQQAAKKSLHVLASTLSLPDFVTAEAVSLYMQASNKELARGRDNTTLAYACVYTACLMHELPKTPLEVTINTPVSKTKMLRTYRTVARTLNLRINPMRSTDLIVRFGTILKLRPHTISRAAELACQHRHRGKKPETIAAAALYIAAAENAEYRTQREIANTTGVIELTIRRRAKEMKLGA